jgi:hypothetical protein
VAQAVRIVAVFVTAANLINPLGQNIVIRMADVTLVPTVRQGRREAFGQTNLEVNAAQQNRTKIGRQAPTSEIGTDTMGWNRCKTQLL